MKYEYLIEENLSIDDLNSLGDNGWELVSTDSAQVNKGGDGSSFMGITAIPIWVGVTLFYMKRSK